jgi:leucyl aminopeptidase
MLEILFQSAPANACACIFVDENLNILANEKAFDENPIVREFLQSETKKFKGDHLESKLLSTLNIGKISYILLLGVGKVSDLTELKMQQLGSALFHAASKHYMSHVEIELGLANGISQAQLNSNLAYGAMLASYRFDHYKTENKKSEQISLYFTTNKVESEEAFQRSATITKGIFFARDCINLAPNDLHPESYAIKIQSECANIPNLSVHVLGESEMQHLGMGALLGVGQGSIRESKLVVVEYHGDEKKSKPIAFVGKGVTFDTGGISLKPALGMDQMKGDMAGSAAVIGAIKAMALRSAKVNLVGVVGLVENMPGHNAQRPGDIVKTMSGKTVEVLNTDAEGRLVLADALWYTHVKFAPQVIIDLATLTGAIVIALGSAYAGCFSPNEDLIKELITAGKETGEELWHMPLHKEYEDAMKSSFADLANISKNKGEAGSCTAAQFLQSFVPKEVKWAHLDIAGVAYTKKAQPSCVEGGLGFGVALLNRFVEKFYESKE